MMGQLTPADYLAMLRRRWLLITVLTIIGGPLAYVVSKTLQSKYTSQTSVLIEQPTVPREFIRPVVTEDISQRLASMKQQILSRSRLEPVIAQFGLYSDEVKNVPMEDLVGRLQKAVEVTPIRAMEETSTQLPGFNVTVTLDNPRMAQNVCTAITSMFIAENLRLRQQHSEDTTEFLAQQLADAKKRLDDQDEKVRAFKSRYLGSLPDQEQTNLNILMGLTSQLDAATQALSRAQQDKSFAQSNLNQALDAWQGAQNGHNPQTLEQQLTFLQTQLAELQTRYTDSYPDVVRTKGDIAALKKKISDQGETASDTPPAEKGAKPALEPEPIQRLRAQIHSLDQMIAEKTNQQEEVKRQIKEYQGRVQSSPSVEQEYTELTRGYQTALESYNELQKNRDQAAMATNLERRQEGEQFTVLDPANLPDRPSFPNRPLFALGGFGGGLALGLGLAFFLEMQDTSIRNERDVEVLLRLPVIAVVPAIGPLASNKPKRSRASVQSSDELGANARA
jgi:polysaccharide chain length determinant protein (PEP-CTERM system associated)